MPPNMLQPHTLHMLLQMLLHKLPHMLMQIPLTIGMRFAPTHAPTLPDQVQLPAIDSCDPEMPFHMLWLHIERVRSRLRSAQLRQLLLLLPVPAATAAALLTNAAAGACLGLPLLLAASVSVPLATLCCSCCCLPLLLLTCVRPALLLLLLTRHSDRWPLAHVSDSQLYVQSKTVTESQYCRPYQRAAPLPGPCATSTTTHHLLPPTSQLLV